MTRRQLLLEAWRGLAQHGLRASLSVLGVIVGIATIVAALAVAEGARRRAYDDVSALGLGNVFIRAQAPLPGRPAAARFTPADLEALGRDDAALTVAGARRARGVLAYETGAVTVEIAGVTPAWRQVAGLGLADGRWLSDDDMLERRRVIVLAPSTARTLLGPNPPAGGRVRWRGQWFTVIGILEPGRRVSGLAEAYVPATAADMPLGSGDSVRNVQEIVLRAATDAASGALAHRAAGTLVSRGHHRDTFDLVVPTELLRARLAAQRTFDRVLLAIGGLALGISGIGIMNIMLASVAARTPEIGIRRAAGARRRDILGQFAAEATLMCLAGGLAGVPLGALLAALIAAAAGWPVALSVPSILLALATAVAAGLLSGLYPARRASCLDPVVAIRG